MSPSFSQRYGYEPLPKPMRLEELSSDLRVEIWNEVREFLLGKRDSLIIGPRHFFTEQAKRFIERVIGRYTERPSDTISTEYKEALITFKNSMLSDKFNRVLDLIEIMVNDKDVTEDFVKGMNTSFEQCAAAYRLDTSHTAILFRSAGQQGTRRGNTGSHQNNPRKQIWRCSSASPSSDRTHQCATICRFDCRQHPCCGIRRPRDRPKGKQDPRSGAQLP